MPCGNRFATTIDMAHHGSHLLPIVWLTLAATVTTIAQDVRPAVDEATLYEKGLKQIEAGKFEQARLSLQTMINSYPRSSLRQGARLAIRTSWIKQGIENPDPMLLFQEAQTRAAAGNYEAARLAYQTVINTYSSSASAEKARQALREIER